jgi:putative hydrolase of the HAD superfamily
MHPVWLFDLDNTLHNASPHIFPHINRSMTDYLMRHFELDEAAANRLRVDYWRRYGATLTGPDASPRHPTACHFLHDTHQFPDLARMVVFDNALRHMLRSPARPEDRLLQRPQPHYAEAVLDDHGHPQTVTSKTYTRSSRCALTPNPKPDRLPASASRITASTPGPLHPRRRQRRKPSHRQTPRHDHGVDQPQPAPSPTYVDFRLTSVLGLARRAIRQPRFGVKYSIPHFQTA